MGFEVNVWHYCSGHFVNTDLDGEHYKCHLVLIVALEHSEQTMENVSNVSEKRKRKSLKENCLSNAKVYSI